jgi:predicted Ser/Thr protein kinase
MIRAVPPATPPSPRARIPDRPFILGVPLSFAWALCSLCCCVGLSTPFIIGHAAVRLRSRNLGYAAVGYGVTLICCMSLINTYSDQDPATPDPPIVDVAAAVLLLVVMLGGTIHALVLRSMVFGPAMAAPTPHSVSWHSPMHAPRTTPQGPPPPTPQPAWSPQRAQPSQLGWFGHYTLIRTLGEGGQGIVYLGQGPDGRPVAVKVLRDPVVGGDDAQRRFLQEVSNARRVPGYSTARILDAGMMGDRAYIVSEYVHGPSLERLVADERPLDGDSLTRLAIATAAALKGIHAAGVVHRDFKPANVLIGSDGPRVIDFGIARALDHVTLTTGGLRGTPPYMSPEQLHGEPAGPAGDIFSWASTMFYGATGQLAFTGSSFPEIVHKILSVQPDLAALPLPLRAPLAGCFEQDPRNRPTAADLMLALTR